MSHHVLVLGGNGKIARLLTPLLLKRSWAVTSIIRDPAQVADVEKLGSGGSSGKLNVLVRSLEEVKSQDQAKKVIDEVKPDYVVWSAGAGGKGGPQRTFAIDRDACIYFIRAAAATPSITRFVLVSFRNSRRSKPSFWSDATWEKSQKAVSGGMKNYYEAKLAADEELYRVSKKRGSNFAGVDLRPGTLTLEPARGVDLGINKTLDVDSSREGVAQVIDELLAADGLKTSWLDFADGDESVKDAVKRVIRDHVDAIEGEPVTKEA